MERNRTRTMMGPRGSMVAAMILLTLTDGTQALADQFHYNNFLMGTRAIGLGGAYAGASDDASGVYYNPAGLAFALSNDISGSANAYYAKKITYKKTIGDEDFVEESFGSVPAFLGGLQKLDHLIPGTVFAFGIYSTDADLKDQDTLIENKVIGASTIDRFHRTSNLRANTFFAGGALAKRFGSSFSVGLAINYFSVDELVQEYQDVKQSATATNGSTVWTILSQNVRQHLTANGVEPVLGFQFAFAGQFSLGLTLRKGIILSQKMDVNLETRSLVASDPDLDPQQVLSANYEIVSNDEVEKPLGTWPGSARFGIAWFPSTTWMLAFDVTHHESVKDAAKVKVFGDKAMYKKEAVTNFHFGAEYYVTPSFPVRLGVFTNNDARPKIEDSKTGQPDHVDYVGETLFIAWVQPNSQISGGLVLQQGGEGCWLPYCSGKAQKTGDKNVQDVVASANTFAFSASHNF